MARERNTHSNSQLSPLNDSLQEIQSNSKGCEISQHTPPLQAILTRNCKEYHKCNRLNFKKEVTCPLFPNIFLQKKKKKKANNNKNSFLVILLLLLQNRQINSYLCFSILKTVVQSEYKKPLSPHVTYNMNLKV